MGPRKKFETAAAEDTKTTVMPLVDRSCDRHSKSFSPHDTMPEFRIARAMSPAPTPGRGVEAGLAEEEEAIEGDGDEEARLRRDAARLPDDEQDVTNSLRICSSDFELRVFFRMM